MRCSSVKYSVTSQKGCRFDASFHLSDGLVTKRVIMSSPYRLRTIGEVSSRIFIGNRAKRVYVTKRDNGIPFLSSSNILQADLENVKLASKKYMPVEEMTLQKGWTLISRSGTIGNCAFANARHAQKLASEDVIRVIPNDILREGVIYAYLASKYGYSLLTQGTFGAVIQHIEPDFVASIPIPDFPSDFQKQVDDLIQESARLREEAYCLLKTAHAKIESILSMPDKLPNRNNTIKDVIHSHNTRFEGAYYISDNRCLYDYITKNYKYKTLNDYTERIFRPGIFKREYVNKGVIFLGGADIMMAIPKSDKQLSFRQVAKMPELKVKKGWMLVTCGGTIGNTVYIDKQLEQCAISQHVMRVVPRKGVLPGFLYAYLSSQIGYKLITMFTYGSVIPSVEPHHLDLVPIPDFEETDMQNIDYMIQEHVSKIELAKEKELKAITLVEEEIEKWNK